MSPANKIPPPGSARLFADSQPPAPAGVHVANIDGASRGNPGPASYAVVLRDPAGKVVLELAKNIGRETNNVAEYFALLAALDYASSHNITALRIRSDSELLVRQMQGRYKVKSADLKPLQERAAKLTRQLQYFVIEHVRREQNRDADLLANVALDSAGIAKFEDRKSHIEPPKNAGLTAKNGPKRSTAEPAPDSPPSASQNEAQSRSIRARFINGTFVPKENVDLANGSEVILHVRIPHKK
ncbi:MAG: reverse transcriptase-like protein [Candidatus Acidiferrales bacterium]